jgi:DNA (cytosine-5)-methyltransferase 1
MTENSTRAMPENFDLTESNLNTLHSPLKIAPYTNLTPTIFSFFSGAGFLDLGFEIAGFEIAYVNEVHKPFLDAYKYARQKMAIPEPAFGYFEGDIESCLHGDESERLTNVIKHVKQRNKPIGFIGGPPCPDFSVGGKNRGQHGDNGKLSKIYVDLICKQKPDFFVFENVKGLYRTVKHRQFFDALKTQLHEASFRCTERLINSIEYGAPQDRERIILFGVRQEQMIKNLHNFNWYSYTQQEAKKILSHPWPEAEPIAQTRLQPNGIIKELTIQHWFEKNDVEQHPNASHQFKPRAGLEKFMTVEEGDDSKKSYKRLHRWRYSPTAAYGNNEVHIHPYLPRRISVAEALAIQSLPKEFELPANMTLSNMFKTVGNGVPFLAAQGLAKTILEFFEEVRNENNSK